MEVGAQRQETWIARNWRWLAVCGCAGALLLVVAFVAVIFLTVSMGMRSSAAYTEALAAVQSDPEAIAALGQPIEAGWWVSGTISATGSSGSAEMSIPVSGPAGAGTVYLIAEKRAGRWDFELLELQVEGVSDRIDLLPVPAD